MTDIERVKKVINWLIFEDIGSSQKEIAELCGYQESYVSQVLSGKVNLSSRFIKKLSELDSRVSESWMLNGAGDMLVSDNPVVQCGDNNNNQQGHAGHNLTQTNNSKEIFEGFIEALKSQQTITLKSLDQVDASMKQTQKAIDEISEHRKQTDSILDMLRKVLNKE